MTSALTVTVDVRTADVKIDHREISLSSTRRYRSGLLGPRPCLEGKGCLQTLIPSLCSRPRRSERTSHPRSDLTTRVRPDELLLTCTSLRCPGASVGGALIDVFVPEGVNTVSSVDLTALDER